jgi:hypothetical protein
MQERLKHRNPCWRMNHLRNSAVSAVQINSTRIMICTHHFVILIQHNPRTYDLECIHNTQRLVSCNRDTEQALHEIVSDGRNGGICSQAPKGAALIMGIFKQANGIWHRGNKYYFLNALTRIFFLQDICK